MLGSAGLVVAPAAGPHFAFENRAREACLPSTSVCVACKCVHIFLDVHVVTLSSEPAEHPEASPRRVASLYTWKGGRIWKLWLTLWKPDSVGVWVR